MAYGPRGCFDFISGSRRQLSIGNYLGERVEITATIKEPKYEALQTKRFESNLSLS